MKLIRVRVVNIKKKTNVKAHQSAVTVEPVKGPKTLVRKNNYRRLRVITSYTH